MNNPSFYVKNTNQLPLNRSLFLYYLLPACLMTTLLTACLPGEGRESFFPVNNLLLLEKNSIRKNSRLIAVWQETTPGKKQWGFMDGTGRFIIPPAYEGACDELSAGLLTVKQKGRWGVIDREQQVVLDFIYPHPLFFSNGLAPVEITGRWGFINRQGQMAIEPVYDQVKLFVKDGKQLLARARLQGAWRLIDETGKVVLASRFELITDCYDGLIGVKVAGKCGFINKNGELIVKPVFKNVKRFSYRLAPVQTEDGRWGFIDTAGEWVAKPVYSDADYAGDAHYYPVKEEAFWGYIDSEGQIKIPPMYDEASPFWTGLARVAKKNMTGYINKQNKVIWEAGSAYYFIDDKDLHPSLKNRILAALKDQMELPGNANKRIIKARPWGITDNPPAYEVHFLSHFTEYKLLHSHFSASEATASENALNTHKYPSPATQTDTNTLPLNTFNTDWMRFKTWYGQAAVQSTDQSREELHWFRVEFH